MSRVLNFFKSSYIFIIIGLFYLPLVFALIFSFNAPNNKGNQVFTNWNGFTWSGWSEIFTSNVLFSLVNSLIIGTIVTLIVIAISLLTTYSLWRQKNLYKNSLDSVNNIPLINADIVTAIGLAIVFGLFFGTLTVTSDGAWRAIIGQVTIILPYVIVLMYPRSQKFSKNLIEASKDLGYGVVRTWFKTYFRYMLPIILLCAVVSYTLSFDDFIIARITSNTDTIGTRLYESEIKGWGLALGSIIFITSLLSFGIFYLIKGKKINSNSFLIRRNVAKKT